MAPSPVTMGDLEIEGHCCYLKHFYSYALRNIVLSMMCLHMNRGNQVACNFHCIFENGGPLKVTSSHAMW